MDRRISATAMLCDVIAVVPRMPRESRVKNRLMNSGANEQETCSFADLVAMRTTSGSDLVVSRTHVHRSAEGVRHKLINAIREPMSLRVVADTGKDGRQPSW